MDTVTYPNEKVASFITEHFIPLKLNILDNPEPAKRYQASWTPTILVRDADGREYHRHVGYLPPDDFLAQLSLARGMTEFERQNFGEAVNRFQEVINQYPTSSAAPQACYYMGVSHYKLGDREKLMAAWGDLMKNYPDNDWAKKASFAFEK